MDDGIIDHRSSMDQQVGSSGLEASPSYGGEVNPQRDFIPYEERLNQNSRWAMSEGSLFFEGEGSVQKALIKITRRLNELKIPYAVAGGMALYQHGFRRFTEDVDILVTREGLKQIHAKLSGLGWVPPFTKSKNLRDAEFGVKIEFLLTGDYPGDGLPKPVVFAEPADVSVTLDGINYLALPTLVELKLASGMTGGMSRMKDFVDVMALIKVMNLPASLVDELNPYVHEKYSELWTGVHDTPDPMAERDIFD